VKPVRQMGLFSNAGGDLAAGLVVFFISVPLCLGVALASGAPLFSGIVTGMIGGIVVGLLSKSDLSVSGPAAGLTAIVLAGITELGAFNIFLCSVMIAGALQIILGFIRAGGIANYFPSCVIEGMLAAIGIIIILKQIPHAVGFDQDAEGNFSFANLRGGNTFSAFSQALEFINLGAVLVTLVAVAILIIWDKTPALKKLKMLPGPMMAVVSGMLLSEIFRATGSGLLAINDEHMVNLPVTKDISGFFAQFMLPDFSGFSNSAVWRIGVVIAIVASIETLLCIEAVDSLDPHRRFTPPNQELKAQGVGNIVSGFLGGLPVTSVIVRSSANINANAQSKLSTITHGVLLLLCAALIPSLLNRIPLAALAAILIMTGIKLAKPSLFKKMWANGLYQFAPFMITIIAVVFTDLLKGVMLGMAVSIFLILRENLRSPYFFQRKEYHAGDIIHIHLAQEVSFLNKAAIKMTLEHLPKDSYVIIEAGDAMYIDFDVVELIKEFKEIKAPERNIRVDLVGFKPVYKIDNTLNRQLVYVENRSGPLVAPMPRGEHGELLQSLTTEAGSK
jgi:MFS superfamily sulfate permease-like transporter